MLSRRFFGDNKRFMRFPELKLSYSRYLFHLVGTYEEFLEGVLITEGTIELSLVKNNNDDDIEEYQVVRMIFYPRMMLQEEVE
jgi:hypothetical protein